MASYWRTYTSEQARQVWSGIQILLDEKLLDEDEKKIAKSIQGRLQYIMWGEDGGYKQISFNEKEDVFLSRIEASLWR